MIANRAASSRPQANGRGEISRVTSAATSFTRSGRSVARPPRPWSGRPTFWLTACAVLLGGVIAAYTISTLSKLRGDTLANGGRELENLSLILATQTDNTFATVVQIEANVQVRLQTRRLTTADDFARQMSGEAMHQMLRESANGIPGVSALALINADGHVVNSSRDPSAPDLDVKDRISFTRLKSDPQSTSDVGAPIRDPADGSLTIPVAHRISGLHGEFLGLIVGTVPTEYFERYFGAIALGDGGAIALVRADGEPLAHYPRLQGELANMSFADTSLFRDALSKADAGIVRMTGFGDHRDRLVAGHKLSHFPVVIVVGREVGAILSDWTSQAMYWACAAFAAVLLVGAVAFIAARRVTAQLQQTNERLLSAINNMSQGLCMFDASASLMVCNERYCEIYRLPPELVAPGCKLQDMLSYRVAAGTFPGDPAQYCDELISAMAEGRTTESLVELVDGRNIAVVNWPMRGGGWVATHEDVTESKRREASFRLLFESNPVPLWVYDTETLRFLAVNDAAIAHYGYSREQYDAMTVCDIRPAAERERFRQFVRLSGGAHRGGVLRRHCCADGSEIDVVVYARSMTYEGRPAALVAIHDITKEHRADRQREQTERFLNAIIENIPVSIIVKEPRERRYVLLNRAAEDLLGLPRERIVGRTAEEFFPKATADLANVNDLQSLESPYQLFFHTQEIDTPANGRHKVSIKRLTILGDDRKPEYLLSLIEDITDRARAEERIAHMAHHDALTDLPNRVLLRERLEAALAYVRRGERLAVHYLDLDRFKSINDTLGHAVGDELLKSVAVRLRGCVRECDTVARLGGDEFAIVQIGLTDFAEAADLAQRIVDVFKAPFDPAGHHVTTDASVGIAIAPNDGDTVDQLLKSADLALYGAKADGRGSFRFFEAEMDVRMKVRHSLEIDLRHALANGEFELHYQPQINLLSQRICGCEALLRWRHPKRGMISPAEFVPVAEETGLIVALGEWVVRSACADVATWPDDVKVAINISPAQLMNQNLLPMVVSALAASGLQASRLEFEITEAVLLQNNERTMASLHQLRELGARIALDDFGTGYSSLSYLRRFPFDKIKIDRSFIQDVAGEGGSLAIVQAIMNLAFSLNMTTTAEGVENEEQLEIVRALGCTELQGFLFSAAKPADEIIRMFRQQPQNLSSVA
jgi:diguanylate cyclase (GGDEF)-like protein/PAS domain S-box-containing protein